MTRVFYDFAEVPHGDYSAITADPPWDFKSNSKAKPGKNPRRHYDTMSVDEICAMSVAPLGKENCALFLWITGPFLAKGSHLLVMEAWGFEPSGMAFTWIKLNQRAPQLVFTHRDFSTGPGFTTRKNAEFVVLGKRGKSVRVDKMVHEVIVAPKRRHSEKPPEFRERVEKYVGPDARCLEMFARRPWPGHDAFGKEVEKFTKFAA